MKILISGGHLTPALAFIDYIQEQSTDHSFIFAGRIYSQLKTKQKAKEKSEVLKRKIPFIAFDSGKLGQGSLFLLPFAFIQIVVAFFHALYIFNKYKPDLYLSFGSYLSVPLAFAAWFLRIKIVVHEQTRTIGIANRVTSKMAAAVALSYPETKKDIHHSNSVVTGNPIRNSILKVNTKKPNWFKTKSTDSILYIAGGSQGSEIINTNIKQLISTLTKNWIVIHQCGPKTNARNYKRELETQRKKISLKNKSKYFIREWVNEEELSWIYSHTKAAISRAGANTVAELSLRHIPTIYIPLPFSHANEQYLNAKFLADTKQALLLQQKDLSPEVLLETIEELVKKHKKITAQLTKNQNKKATGNQKLLKLILSVQTLKKK